MTRLKRWLKSGLRHFKLRCLEARVVASAPPAPAPAAPPVPEEHPAPPRDEEVFFPRSPAAPPAAQPTKDPL
jgi:hypothetical protein